MKTEFALFKYIFFCTCTFLFISLNYASAQNYAGGSLSYILKNDSLTFTYSLVNDCIKCSNNCPDPKLYLKTNADYQELHLTKIKTDVLFKNKNCFECSPCTDANCNNKVGYKLITYTSVIALNSLKIPSNCMAEAKVIAPKMAITDNIVAAGNIEQLLSFNICEENISPVLNQNGFLNCVDYKSGFNLLKTEVDPPNEIKDNYSISLTKVKTELQANVSYRKPYNAENPLPYLGFGTSNTTEPYGFNLSDYGFLSYQITKEGKYMIRFEVVEKRKDKIISISQHDIMATGIQCSTEEINKNPNISGANCSESIPNNYKIAICALDTVKITICSDDENKNDSVTLDWNHGIPDAEFKILDPKAQHQKAQFTWYPHNDEVSLFPYTITVSAQDNACINPGYQSRPFQFILTHSLDIETNAIASDCGEVTIDFKTLYLANVDTWEVVFDKDTLVFDGKTSSASFNNVAPGIYNYKVSAKGVQVCKDQSKEGTVEVYNTSPLKYSIHEIKYCKEDENVLIDVADMIRNGTQIIWQDTNLVSKSRIIKTPLKDTILKYVASNQMCTDTAIVNINQVQLKPQNTSILSRVGTAPLKVTFEYPKNDDAELVNWSFGDLQNSTATGKNVSFTYTDAGEYLTVVSSEGYGCKSDYYVLNTIRVFPTSIDELRQLGVQIYPQPNNGKLHIENHQNKLQKIELINLTGQVLLTKKTQNGTNNMDLSMIKNGNYILKMHFQNQIQSCQIQVIH